MLHCQVSKHVTFHDKNAQGRTCDNPENIKLCEIVTSAALTLICSNVDCKRKMPPDHITQL